MRSSDFDYYCHRIAQEQSRLMASDDPSVRLVSQRLIEMYESRLDAIKRALQGA